MDTELIAVIISVVATSLTITQNFRRQKLNEQIEDTRAWQNLNDLVENIKLENAALNQALDTERTLRQEDTDRLRREIDILRRSKDDLMQQVNASAVMKVQLKTLQNQLEKCLLDYQELKEEYTALKIEHDKLLKDKS